MSPWFTIMFLLAAANPLQAAPERIPFQGDVVVEFAVADLDRSVHFYTELLDLELLERVDAIGWARIRTAVPGVSIGLNAAGAAAKTGSGSASINLAVGQLDEVVALLQSRGITFAGPIVSIPGVVRLADFEDPDGNRIRLAGAAPKRAP